MAERARGLDEVLEELARRVRATRRKLRLSQEAVAHRAGLQRAHVGHVEQAKNDIRLSTALRLAYALEVDIADLLAGLALPDPSDAG